MKTSRFDTRIPRLPRLARVGACLVVLAGALVVGAGACNEGGQGDRCNPLRSSNECGGGLVCAGNPIGQSVAHPIPYCPENYCCPANADGTVDYASASSPYCQPGCNGGATAICASTEADAEACSVAACLADASDPTTCVPEDAGPEPTPDASGDGAAPEGEAAAPSEASSVADSSPAD